MNKKNLLFADKRQHSKPYYVEVRGREERTFSVRGGISWPQAGIPGYFILVAQLEETTEDKSEKRIRFLAFKEGQVNLMTDFMKKISSACANNLIDGFCHGDEPGDESFSHQLHDFLRKKRAGEGREILQMPIVYKSWRCKDADFLSHLVRGQIADKTLLFSDRDRIPLLIDKIRHTDMEANILEVPEIRALAHVMDDFDISPWRPPEPPPERRLVL